MESNSRSSFGEKGQGTKNQRKRWYAFKLNFTFLFMTFKSLMWIYFLSNNMISDNNIDSKYDLRLTLDKKPWHPNMYITLAYSLVNFVIMNVTLTFHHQISSI